MVIQFLDYKDLVNFFKNDDGLIDQKKMNNFKYFSFDLFRDASFVIGAIKDGDLVGLAQCGHDIKNNRYWLSFVTVHPEHRQKGVSKQLIRFIFNFLDKENTRFELSTYEKEGEVMISMIQEMAHNYPNLKIYHRQIGQAYQLATNHFYKVGDIIQIDDSENSFTGRAEVRSIMDLSDSIRIYYRHNDGFRNTDIKNCSPIE